MTIMTMTIMTRPMDGGAANVQIISCLFCEGEVCRGRDVCARGRFRDQKGVFLAHFSSIFVPIFAFFGAIFASFLRGFRIFGAIFCISGSLFRFRDKSASRSTHFWLGERDLARGKNFGQR